MIHGEDYTIDMSRINVIKNGMKAYYLLLVTVTLIGMPGLIHAHEVLLHLPGDDLKVQSDTEGKAWFNNSSRVYSQKGKFFFQSGFNWSYYGKSDIRLAGPGYDFTLKDVVGKDQPYKTSLQYNVRAGFFLKDNYSVSLGFDHMKYVMKVPQTVVINGFIQPEVSIPGVTTSPYSGSYNNESITIVPQMLTLEYTDGFNYISTHVQRYDDIWISGNGKASCSVNIGLGAGLIIPRSDVRLFGVGTNNKLNVSGWGASVEGGLMFNFNKNIYLSGNLEAGHSDMSKIHTTGRNNLDSASQKLNFLQNTYFIGIRF